MGNAKKTAGKMAEIPESRTVNVCGVISDMMYGKRTYNNGRKDKEDKFRLSLKLADGQMEKFAEIAAPYRIPWQPSRCHKGHPWFSTPVKQRQSRSFSTG